MSGGSSWLILGLLIAALAAWGFAEAIHRLGKRLTGQPFHILLTMFFTAMALSATWIFIVFVLMVISNSGNPGILFIATPLVFLTGAIGGLGVGLMRREPSRED